MSKERSGGCVEDTKPVGIKAISSHPGTVVMADGNFFCLHFFEYPAYNHVRQKYNTSSTIFIHKFF